MSVIAIHQDKPARARKGSNAKQSRLPRVFLAGTEKAIAHRADVAEARVNVIRAAHPNWSDDQIAKRIVKRYLTSVTLVGAGTGGTAAIPGVGFLIGNRDVNRRRVVVRVGKCPHDHGSRSAAKRRHLRP